MPKELRNYEDELRAIMDALAESVAELSDEEILAETRAEGQDPNLAAEHVRQVLRTAAKVYQQRLLREARAQYERRVAAMREGKYSLPDSPEERRRLLADVFDRKPDIRSGLLTAQHREFSSLTDADVESYLKQLQELGVLDGVRGPEDKER